MNQSENTDSFHQAASGNRTEEKTNAHEANGGVVPSPAPENKSSGDDGGHGDGTHEEQSYIYRDFSHVPDDTTCLDLIRSRAQAPSKKLPAKLQGMLTDPELSSIIAWLPHGRSWQVLDRHQFTTEVLPKQFNHSNFESFTRLVNAWGFRRVPSGVDRGSYYHELFLRGMPHLHSRMKRMHSKKAPMESKDHCPNFYKMPLPDDPKSNTTQTRSSAMMGTSPLNTAVAAAATTAPIETTTTASQVTVPQMLSIAQVPTPLGGMSSLAPNPYPSFGGRIAANASQSVFPNPNMMTMHGLASVAPVPQSILQQQQQQQQHQQHHQQLAPLNLFWSTTSSSVLPQNLGTDPFLANSFAIPPSDRHNYLASPFLQQLRLLQHQHQHEQPQPTSQLLPQQQLLQGQNIAKTTRTNNTANNNNISHLFCSSYSSFPGFPITNPQAALNNSLNTTSSSSLPTPPSNDNNAQFRNSQIAHALISNHSFQGRHRQTMGNSSDIPLPLCIDAGGALGECVTCDINKNNDNNHSSSNEQDVSLGTMLSADLVTGPGSSSTENCQSNDEKI